jgi:hypothetical protein
MRIFTSDFYAVFLSPWRWHPRLQKNWLTVVVDPLGGDLVGWMTLAQEISNFRYVILWMIHCHSDTRLVPPDDRLGSKQDPELMSFDIGFDECHRLFVKGLIKSPHVHECPITIGR